MHAGLNQWGNAVAHFGEIFIEMLHNVRSSTQRGQHIDEAEHLDFEVLVAHRELHYSLVKSGFAKNRFRITIDQLKDTCSASLDFRLQGTHARL